MTTVFQDADFKKVVVIDQIPNDLLETAIAWIANNMSPEDVFDKKVLEGWAEDNGYVIPEE